MTYLGLSLLIFFLPFTYWRFPLNIKISEGIALVIMFPFILSILIKRRPIYPTPFLLPMLVIIFVASLSLIQMQLIPSEVYNESWAHGRYNPDLSGIISIFRYIFLLCFMILIVNMIRSEEVLKKSIKIYLISGGIVSIIGLLQLIAYYTNLDFLSRFTNLFSEGWHGTPLVPQYLGNITIPRIMGPNNEPKMFSNTLVAILPFTLMAIIHKWKIFKIKTLWCLLFLQALALFFTFSASGWFAITIALLFLLTELHRKYRLNFIVKSVMPLVTLFFLASLLFDIHLSTVLSFNVERIVYYFSSPATIGQLGPFFAGVEMFKDHPILGVGVGNFPFHFYNYNVLNLPYYADYGVLASNEYISILAETGLLGAISWLPFIFVIIKLIKESIHKEFKRQYPFLSSLFIASLSATLGAWSQLWATYGIFNPHIWFPLALAIAARRLLYLENKNKYASKGLTN